MSLDRNIVTYWTAPANEIMENSYKYIHSNGTTLNCTSKWNMHKWYIFSNWRLWIVRIACEKRENSCAVWLEWQQCIYSICPLLVTDKDLDRTLTRLDTVRARWMRDSQHAGHHQKNVRISIHNTSHIYSKMSTSTLSTSAVVLCMLCVITLLIS